MEPWIEDERLEADKLIEVASILRDVRNQASELHEPYEGDNAWSLGTRVYARQIHVLGNEAENLDWLSTQRNNLEFTMAINSVPVRFYKGIPEKPTRNTLRVRYDELRYQQLMMPIMGEAVCWRFAQETNADGSLFRISLVKLDEEGNSLGIWEVPLEESVRSIGLMGGLETAVDLPPAVSVVRDRQDMAQDNENAG